MSERDWIDKYIRPLARSEGADYLLDDVAQLSKEGVQIATMDTLVEGVHFLSADPLATIGQKLLRVNISDILAKGARPHEALLSIAWPKARSEADFAALLSGIGQDLRAYGISLLGGDFVSIDGPLTLTLTLTGVCLGSGPVRRLGKTKPGDAIWVSGQIGWGHLGLEEAKAGSEGGAALRYRVPGLPSLENAKEVAAKACASMDVSDGLLVDLKQLIEVNGRGAELWLDRVPFARPTHDLDLALKQASGGDDYQILLIAPDGAQFTGFTRIGQLTQALGLNVLVQGQPVNLPKTLGFEH